MTLEAQIEIIRTDLEKAQGALVTARIKFNDTLARLATLRREQSALAVADPQVGDLFLTGSGGWLLVVAREEDRLDLQLSSAGDGSGSNAEVLIDLADFRERYARATLERRGMEVPAP
jgi:hypothetical protein